MDVLMRDYSGYQLVSVMTIIKYCHRLIVRTYWFHDISGDVMGPSLTGLEGLLRLPTGCGEQNMVKFAPNIFIMQYLSSTNQLTSNIKTKAIGFLRTGNPQNR